MVRVDVGVEHVSDRPSALACELDVRLRIERRIDDQRFRPGSDQIRESAFPCSTELDQRRARRGELGGVPGQAPGLHPSHQGGGIEATPAKLDCGDLAGASGPTNGDDRPIGRERYIGQGRRIACSERIVGVSMDAPGNAPFGTFNGWAYVEHGDWLVPLEHCAKG
jgi:hypothetical protein